MPIVKIHQRHSAGLLTFLLVCSIRAILPAAEKTGPVNLLFITVDDMNCDSVGVFGCKLRGTTPNIDRLAAEGLRFKYAHVQVANCMPSRNVMYSGLYPHNNRVEGFYQVKDADHLHLVDMMKAAGYFTAIRGKVSHSTPYHPYAWDLVLDDVTENLHPKNVESYYDSTNKGLAAAEEAGKPFCMIINVSDPHKPFYAMGKKGEVVDDPNVPSHVFTAGEVPVPGFLPDEPIVRKELAHYYSSVRRADDCVGVVLKALDESGHAADTVVMFLSDHGMPLPFAKTAVYHHSTRTPWIVRWPGRVKPGTVDEDHMISAVDLTPTLLEIAGIAPPECGFDGRSFLPLLTVGKQDNRDHIIKEYNENAGAGRHPMRSVETRRFCYIFNPWSDGERVFKTATTGTLTYRKMKEMAKTDKAMAARVELFDHRVPEELYDVENDPDSLNNLIDDPSYRVEADRLRKILLDWMIETGDHALDAFRNRGDAEFVSVYVTGKQAEASARKKQKVRSKVNARRARGHKFFSLSVPKQFTPGEPFTVSIAYEIPASLGEQLLHVTLKDGTVEKRVERKIVTARGRGEVEVTFDLPQELPARSIRAAAFMGKDYPSSLQHVVTSRSSRSNTMECGDSTWHLSGGCRARAIRSLSASTGGTPSDRFFQDLIS